MLQSLRRASQSYAAKILFGILVLSFALWGMGPVFSGSRVSTIATAGDINISAVQVDLAYRQELQKIEQAYGVQITPEMAAQMGMKYYVVRRMVMEALFDQEAQALGLLLGEDEIRQTIAAQPNLRDDNGKFSPALFQALLRQLGMSESAYVMALRRDLTRTVLMGAIRTGAHVPEELARQIYAYAHETRSVTARFVEASSIAIPDPSVEEMQAYYDEHAEDYRAPEFRTMDYVSIDITALKDSITPTEEELETAYTNAPDAYVLPEKRSIRQVTTNNEELARQIAADANSKGSLQEAAEAHNLMAMEVHDLASGAVIPQLNDIIFSLEQGIPSAAVQSPIGWHVIEVTKITPAEPRSFEQARAELLEHVKLSQANDMASGMVTSLEDALASGMTLAEAAEDLGLTLKHVGPVSQTGTEPNGELLSAEDHLADIVRIGFSLEQDRPSRVEEADGAYLAVQATLIEESQIKPFDAVRDNVRSALSEKMQKDAALAKAKDLAKSLNLGELTQELKELGPFNRKGLLGDKGKVELDDAAVSAVFDAKEGEVLSSQSENGSGVLRVRKVIPTDMTDVVLSPARTSWREGYANDILEQYSSALREQYRVKINEKALGASQ